MSVSSSIMAPTRGVAVGKASQHETARGPLPGAAREALRLWDLHDWHVRKTPLFAQADEQLLEIPKHSGVIRDDPRTGTILALGTIGRRNVPIQNEYHAEVIMWMLGVQEVAFLDAGHTGHGQQVFLVCDLPSGFVINSEESGVRPSQGEFELVSVNRHDGGALWFHTVRRGTWKSALRPLFEPRGTDMLPIRTLRDHALSSAHLRHNASRSGIPGKLFRDLRLDLVGGGALGGL